MRELVVMSLCILIIQNCRIIKFRDSCDVPNLYNLTELSWYARVCTGMVRFGRSICVILDSGQLRDHRSIKSISADQTPLIPRFLLVLPFACIQHPESRTSVTAVSIYLEHRTNSLTSVDPQLHSGILFGKFLHFLWVISRSLCALCAGWNSHVHCSDRLCNSAV